MRSAREQVAFLEGQEAVRQKPRYAPQNPYDFETDEELHDAWNDGADEAGMMEIYHNGVLKKEFSR
jgi:hypothetical protein